MNGISGKDRSLVALERCASYNREGLLEVVDKVCRAISLKVSSGSMVLLKPNLVSGGSGPEHLACTSPQFVAAVAEWCLGQGARVKVGDSPAFGTARKVMRACGMEEALRPLDVELVNFNRARRMEMACGLTVPVAAEALDCDLLLNLPRVKAHNQLYVSLAVKNYFGVVAGMRKAFHHAVHGDKGNRFEALLADLPEVFPGSFSLVDGITAMEKSGPMKGDPYPLQVVAASGDPVSLDTALVKIIGGDLKKSQLWVEYHNRGVAGTSLEDITFPLKAPDDLAVSDFLFPRIMTPVSFNPMRMLISSCRRIAASISEN